MYVVEVVCFKDCQMRSQPDVMTMCFPRHSRQNPTRGLLAVSLMICLLPVIHASGAGVTWVSSSSSSSQRWITHSAPILEPDNPSNPPVVLVVPARKFQTIDGFGGCFNELGWDALQVASSADREAVMDALFGTNGCAFTRARVPIGASDFANGYYSLDDTPGDYALTNFSITRDQTKLIPYIQAAMAVLPDLQCWGSPWSPPIWMKDTTGTANGYDGGSIRWEPAVLQTYANYFVRWVEAYRGEGINIYGLLLQNEPNQWQVFPSCVWTGPQLRDYIADYLGPTFAASNLNPSVELWLGINGDWQNNGDDINDRIMTVMQDATASSYLTGIGYQYDSVWQIGDASSWFPHKQHMQTESRCYSGANSWSDAQDLYANMKTYFEKGANAYFAWNMVLDETGLSTWNWQQNAPITVDSGTGAVTYNGEFYVYKHFSHYVKPGAKRILTAGWWGDKIAFENPDGSIVLVMGNSSGVSQTVALSVEGWLSNNTINVTLPPASFNTFVFPPAPVTGPRNPSTPPATLVHRYSFGETSGSTVGDSIGGADGSLPNGGTWGGGELSLSSGSSQYVDLPAHMLDGFTNVTIEAWVSFPVQLPWNCWLFGFGNKSGNEGVNYILCMPESSKIAITDSNWSGEQSAFGSINCSYQNNLHITAVFNTTDGRSELYLNGALDALNINVTLPMSAVNNVYSYIGRSLYANDPYCAVNLDEFRIYDGALTAYEVESTQFLGPGRLLETNSTPISVNMSAGNVMLYWPVGFASSMMLQSRTNLVDGTWQDRIALDPALVGDMWHYVLPASKENESEFFRLRR